jgi:hypothetical protein
LASATIGTLRAAAAAAPRIHELRLVVLRANDLGGDPLLAVSATREGLAAAAGRGPLAGLSVVGQVVLETKGRTKELTPLARTGLVADLLSEVERRPAPPPQPVDVSSMIARQSAQAAEFATRIAALRPDLNPPTSSDSHHSPPAEVSEPQSGRPLPFPKASPTNVPKPDRLDRPRAARDRSKLAMWLGLASIPLVVVAVGIVPAVAAVALAIVGLRRDPSRVERRRFRIAIVSGALVSALWIAIVAAAAA